MKFGYIPKELTLFIQPEKSVFLEWNTPILGKRAENERVEYKARPVFVCDASNKQTKHWTKIKAEEKAEEITIANDVFCSNFIVVSSEIIKDKYKKYQKYFKVIIGIGKFKNLLISVREDVFLETLYVSGSNRNICHGSFLFSKISSRMELIRENSFLHQLSIESTEFKKMSVKKDLEIGGIYANKKGEQYLYLGKYWSTNIIYYGPIGYNYHESISGYGYSWLIDKAEKQSLYYVFYRVYPPLEAPIEFDANYNFHIVKSHSFSVKRDKLKAEEHNNFDLTKAINTMSNERKLHYPLIANLRKTNDIYIDDFFILNPSGEAVYL